MQDHRPSYEYMNIPTSGGHSMIQVRRENGRLEIHGPCDESELEKVFERIRAGRWKDSASDMASDTTFEQVHIGLRYTRNEHGDAEHSWVHWNARAFDIVEIRGEARSGRTDLLRSLMFELRNCSHVYMIDPDGKLSRDLPVNTWWMGKDQPYGVGLFTPFGRKRLDRDQTENTIQMAIVFLRACLGLTPGQEKQLREVVRHLYENYWAEVDKGSAGRPQFPTLDLLIKEVREGRGSTMMALYNKLDSLSSFDNAFNRPIPSEAGAGAFVYPDLPPDQKALMTFLLMNRLATAPFKKVILIEGHDLPAFNAERRFDVLTSMVRGASRGSVYLCYTINDDEKSPWIGRVNLDRLLRIQLKHSSMQKDRISSVGKGFVVGGRSHTEREINKTHIDIPSLEERIEVARRQPGLGSAGETEPSSENVYEGDVVHDEAASSATEAPEPSDPHQAAIAALMDGTIED